MSRSPAALRPFHPIVRDWFRETLGEPSEPQRKGWPVIARGEHTLLLAPTGTGKTLAAFLWELNALITAGLEGPLANAVHLLYISPLKALNNDVQRNLERPLAELRERFERDGLRFPEIRVGVRTGDTPASARARMTRVTPHILITTPESLHILLTTEKARGMFSALRAVIVDEIHAVAGTKRGAHLALTLERLEERVDASPQRIGLSATQRPLEEIARFLGGMEERRTSSVERRNGDESLDAQRSTLDAPSPPRPVAIVDCGLVKKIEVQVASPVPDLANVDGSVWPAVIPLVLDRMRDARTTLVFVNNRAQAERISARINTQAGEELAQPYHGSLSRERRLRLEESLKAGELRALVTTSSLELGIDVGSVDLVLQIQSPKRVAAGLQRVGRAGHSLGAVSRGVLIPTFLDDAMESVAITMAMREGDVEPTIVVQNALDVLAQVIVTAAAADDWTSADLFALVRRAYPYHRLSREAFDETLSMLAGKYPADVAAELAQRVTWDRVTDRITASRASRLTAITSGGTIPDRGLYTVNLPDRTRLGELDEEFVHESRVGDAFTLGSSTWRITAIEHDRVIVAPAPGAPARMPFWHGEYGARSRHLAERVGALRRELTELPNDTDQEGEPEARATSAMARRLGADAATIRSLARYVRSQRAAAGVVPDDRTLLLEEFRDEVGSVRLVLHAPFGGRVTAPWGMVLANRMRERLGDVDVQVQTTDDGIMLRLPDLGGTTPTAAMLGLSSAEARTRLRDEVGSTSLFGARFRMNAARALLLPRGMAHRRMPLWLQRLKSADLLQTVRAFPSFPILVETYRDVLQDAFDLEGLRDVLDRLERGEIAVRTAALERPSPFAASLQFGFVIDWMYGDDTPRAERRAARLALDDSLLSDLLGESEQDEHLRDALMQVTSSRRGTMPGRRARTADELAALLDRAGDLSAEELEERVATFEEGRVRDPVGDLLGSGRALAIEIPLAGERAQRVVLTESYSRYRAAFGQEALGRVLAPPAVFGAVGAPRSIAVGDLVARDATDVLPPALLDAALTVGAARREILRRFLALSGPVSVSDILARYPLPRAWVQARLDEWTAAGRLVRGRFGSAATDGGETTEFRWVWRRALEQAKRRALAAARREIEAVPLSGYVAFLQRWQHLDPRDRLEGDAGTLTALQQLAGLPRPATAWEREYLPGRVQRFGAESLARAASSGRMVWIGGHSESARDANAPCRLTSATFAARGSARRWLRDEAPAIATTKRAAATAESSRSPCTPGEDAQRVLDALASEGASYLADLSTVTGLGAAKLRESLAELAAGGLVTNDSPDALRAIATLQPLPRPARDRAASDPTRWLPANFERSMPVVQRRVNPRRLPKWTRPDRPDAARDAWTSGRWSLVRTNSVLGPDEPEEERAEAIARQWLARYGVVSRDWWRRERPPVPWRDIYYELRRLELRGEVRRGYFVTGLAGAQFALPEAVESLRAAARDAEAPLIVMTATDPANAFALPLPQEQRDPISRPRGGGAILVTRAGTIVLAVESRGRRVRVAPDADEAAVTAAARALGDHLLALAGSSVRHRDVNVETIDGVSAASSRWSEAFRAADFRMNGTALRLLAPVR